MVRRLVEHRKAVLSASVALTVVLFSVLVTATRLHRALAYSVVGGYAASNFATGFPYDPTYNYGPIGVAFDPANNLFVMDQYNATLYKFGPTGGVAGAPGTQVNATPIAGAPTGIAFDRTGHLYVALRTAGQVVELSTTDGSVVRTVASGISVAEGLATDPLSGDLFVSSWLGNSSAANIFRISNFASGTGTLSTYSTLPSVDGLNFGPDGTLYAASGATTVYKVSGTNTATPGAATSVVGIPVIDGLAAAAYAPSASTLFLVGSRNDGTITKIDMTTSTPSLTDIFSGGTRGDFVAVDYNGCLYATQTSSIVKVTNNDGTCALAPTSPDTSAPTTTVTITGKDNPNGWYHKGAVVTLTISDAEGSGNVAFTMYSLDGAAPQVYTAPLTMSVLGAHTLTFWSADKAGTVEAEQTMAIQIGPRP